MQITNRGSITIYLPVYEAVAVASGFYLGYNITEGNPMSETVQYLTALGPTVLSAVMTTVLIKARDHTVRTLIRKGREILREDDPDFETKREKLDCLESKVKEPRYIAPSVGRATITAIETFLGYVMGSCFSELV